MANEIKQHGFIAPEIKPEDYVLGAGQVPEEVLQEDADWIPFVPLHEIQRIGVETYNCTAFGTTNALEILHKRKFRHEINLSDRALGILSDTWPPGNDPHTVAEALRHNGDCPETSLPFGLDIYTLEKYYSPKPLTPELIKECLDFVKNYDFKHEYVFRGTDPQKHDKLRTALKFSPLGASVVAWKDRNGKYYKEKGERDTHWVTIVAFDSLLDGYIVFDSYEPHFKLLEADYDFGFVKRYWLEKKEKKTSDTTSAKNTCAGIWLNGFKKIREWLGFPDRTFGAKRSSSWGTFRRIHIKDYCELCEQKKGILHPLELHHCKPFHLFPELEESLDNVITVCRHCHIRYAHLGSYRSYDIDIKLEAEHWQNKRKSRP